MVTFNKKITEFNITKSIFSELIHELYFSAIYIVAAILWAVIVCIYVSYHYKVDNTDYMYIFGLFLFITISIRTIIFIFRLIRTFNTYIHVKRIVSSSTYRDNWKNVVLESPDVVLPVLIIIKYYNIFDDIEFESILEKYMNFTYEVNMWDFITLLEFKEALNINDEQFYKIKINFINNKQSVSKKILEELLQYNILTKSEVEYKHKIVCKEWRKNILISIISFIGGSILWCFLSIAVLVIFFGRLI